MTEAFSLKSVEMSVGFIIPAKDEESTVGDVVRAAKPVADLLGARVLVVADHCTDATAAEARMAGAEVLLNDSGEASKAAAVAAGIAYLSPDVTCLLDADCRGLTADGVLRLLWPVLSGEAMMSVVVFDYGPWTWLVESIPWSTGQRAFVTDLLPAGPQAPIGYAIELSLNAAVGARGGVTVCQVLPELHHRTKLAKAGVRAGVSGNLKMWGDIAEAAEDVNADDYRAYLAGIVIEHEEYRYRPPPGLTAVSLWAVSTGARLVRRLKVGWRSSRDR